MKELFKSTITDFLDKNLKDIYARDVNIPLESSKIITISGARRVGKTYLLFSIIKQLRKKIENNLLVYINFEDERLYPYETVYLQNFIDAYYQLFPDNRDKTVYFFFDEIQNIPQWELFVRRLYDNGHCKIYLTGSSSKMLSTDIATSLRGRTLNYELFPLSFKEYANILNLDFNFYSSKARSHLLNAFNYYISHTSFPELIHLPPEEAQKSLKEFYELLIYKDLIDRYHIGNTALIKYLTKFLFINTGNFISYNKVYNDIKSQGFNIGRNTVYEYIEYLQSSYSIFTTCLFTDNLREQNRNPRKLYCLDTGLKNLLSINPNIGRSLENIVFLHLRRSISEIYYYKGNQEIDFCYINSNRQINLINVALQTEEQKTYEREINGLKEGMNYFKIKSALIITQNDEKEIKTDGKKIEIIPLWKWLVK